MDRKKEKGSNGLSAVLNQVKCVKLREGDQIKQS